MTAAEKRQLERKCETASTALDAIREFYDDAVTELQEKFDAKSEKWQAGDKGVEMQSTINSLEELRDKAQEAMDLVSELENGPNE